MTFDTLRARVAGLATDSIPQALSEMIACEHLAHFLNATRGTHYNGVSKDEDLEEDGIDAKIYESGNYDSNLYIQVTRAREYDMSPEVLEHPVALHGDAILQALEYKCSIYQKRGVYTQEIALLIVGVTPASIVREHLDHEHFSKPFQQTTCFNGIYYLTGEDVVELKALA